MALRPGALRNRGGGREDLPRGQLPGLGIRRCPGLEFVSVQVLNSSVSGLACNKPQVVLEVFAAQDDTSVPCSHRGRQRSGDGLGSSAIQRDARPLRLSPAAPQRPDQADRWPGTGPPSPAPRRAGSRVRCAARPAAPAGSPKARCDSAHRTARWHASTRRPPPSARPPGSGQQAQRRQLVLDVAEGAQHLLAAVGSPRRWSHCALAGLHAGLAATAVEDRAATNSAPMPTAGRPPLPRIAGVGGREAWRWAVSAKTSGNHARGAPRRGASRRPASPAARRRRRGVRASPTHLNCGTDSIGMGHGTR